MRVGDFLRAALLPTLACTAGVDTLQPNISLEQVAVASMPVKGLRVKIRYSSHLQAVCYCILGNFLFITIIF